jgi:ATP-dependent protease HslVU (ClpYQ) peptidase subunit
VARRRREALAALVFDEPDTRGIVIRKVDAKVYTLQGKTVVLCEARERQIALGSGFEYASAAMALGKSAAQAVAFAARFDVATGLGVDSVRVVRVRR